MEPCPLFLKQSGSSALLQNDVEGRMTSYRDRGKNMEDRLNKIQTEGGRTAADGRTVKDQE